ncbi:MAG TPA: hypothetical protein VEH56_00500 [Candidatus Saccharimonadales bacterium]|nr:hypothetical protein [Candidatus Saccharimonadales bacterium]
MQFGEYDVLTTLPDNVHVVSAVENPEPVNGTLDPTEAEDRPRVMDGTLMVEVEV